jgi:hypothetical protein
MQAFPFLGFELFQRLYADLKVLADALPIEFAGHASKLDLAVERFVRDAKQGAVGHAKTEPIGGDRRGFHIEGDRARLRQTPNDGWISDLPIAVVHARDRSGAHHPFKLEARKAGDFAHRLLERDLHLRQGWDGHP